MKKNTGIDFKFIIRYLSTIISKAFFIILLSMFTALVITRLLMNALYAIGIRDAKWYGIGKDRKNINFLGKKGIFFGVSIAVILAGFVVMGINALNG